jgi:hypothetical protein
VLYAMAVVMAVAATVAVTGLRRGIHVAPDAEQAASRPAEPVSEGVPAGKSPPDGPARVTRQTA